jgi:hypothetical protein
VKTKVKTERELLKDNSDGIRRKRYWWQYGRIAGSLEKALEGDAVPYGISWNAAKYIAFVKLPLGYLYSHALAVLFLQDHGEFAALSSFVHEAWTLKYTSYNLKLPRYTVSDCFQTFPFPPSNKSLVAIGESYEAHRNSIMRSAEEGLTAIYNRFHDCKENASDLKKLRMLHAEMDQAVVAAYGWTDLDLGHGFRETKHRWRFTLSEPARAIVIDRLLALNNERYAKENSAGLDYKKKKAKKAKTTEAKGSREPQAARYSEVDQIDLFGEK